MSKNIASIDYRTLLHGAGSRATPVRLATVRALHTSLKPLSVRDIKKFLPRRTSEVTIYRILEALMNEGVVKKVDFAHEHAHYELAVGKPHHHHLICTSCGTVEDIEECVAEEFSVRALKKSHVFKAITSHALEFFGLCTACVR